MAGALILLHAGLHQQLESIFSGLSFFNYKNLQKIFVQLTALFMSNLKYHLLIKLEFLIDHLTVLIGVIILGDVILLIFAGRIPKLSATIILFILMMINFYLNVSWIYPYWGMLYDFKKNDFSKPCQLLEDCYWWQHRHRILSFIIQ